MIKKFCDICKSEIFDNDIHTVLKETGFSWPVKIHLEVVDYQGDYMDICTVCLKKPILKGVEKWSS